MKEEVIWGELEGVKRAGRWRVVEGAREGVCFSSNDYLDLARDGRVVAAGVAAMERFGAGATGSRLMAGQGLPHAALEEALAGFFGTEAALVFPTGYQANIGVITALAGREAWIFSDALNHASLIDGARLSRAVVKVYPHGDVDALQALLAEAPSGVRKVVVTETVFSMDGDCVPMAAIAAAAARHDAWLVADEAHAVGVLGEGRGLCAALRVRADVILGTLSKALGSQGGFAACSGMLRDLFVNKARTFIFTTGLAPACAAAGTAALGVVQAEPGLGAELLRRAGVFREALRAQGLDVRGETQIVPILLGDEATTMRAAESCRAQGLDVRGIRPPTVSAGECRLRLSVTLGHTEAALCAAAGQIAEAVREARG